MRYLLIASLVALAAARAAAPAPAPSRPPLEVTWRLEQDLFGQSGHDLSVAAFTLTNRGPQALPGRGWAIYYTALHDPLGGSATGCFRIESVTGSLQRIVPGPDFQGLAPGQSVQVEYRTGLLTNNSFAPNGVYLVQDDAPDEAQPVAYTAVPFERAPQPGKDPHVITAEAQFELDSVVHDVPAESLPAVFPTPVSVETREGRLTLTAAPAIAAAPELQGEAALAADYLRPLFAPPKAKRQAAAPTAGAPALRLALGRVEGQASPEAYELLVDPKEGVKIVGNSPAGVFYGLQSLRGLLPFAARPLAGAKRNAVTPPTLPALRAVDAPRFGYRGLMLDVARNFQPKAQVFRVLDLLSRYKLNVLRLHLTEDEAWRVEMPSLPELTAVGARRGHTLDSLRQLPPAFGSGGDATNPYGSGFYSRADYVEILRYAAARHVQVIPEIEMPGHARAAIKSMEARARALRERGDEAGAAHYLLSDPGDESVYTSAQGYHDNVMNPALPGTYAFIERVVADLAALHAQAGVPLRNLHLGGDEVPAGVWERSPAVAAYMKEHAALASVEDLWYVFYGRVEQILEAHGLVPAGWEELGLRYTRLDGRRKMIPNPDFAARGWTAYVWNNAVGGGAEDLAYRMANAGYKVVLVPVSNNYLDLAWNKNPEERGLDWGGYVGLEKPFSFIPFDYYRNTRYDSRGNPVDPSVFVGKDRLTDYGRSNVVGVEGALWSETLGGEGRLDYMLLPKLYGLAERAWAPDPAWAVEKDKARSDALFRDAYSAFASLVGRRELPRLDRETPAWSYRIPKPGLKVVDGLVRTSLEIPGFVLRYTTDGTEPGVRSPEARGPLPASPQLRVAAFDTNGRKGHTARLASP